MERPYRHIEVDRVLAARRTDMTLLIWTLLACAPKTVEPPAAAEELSPPGPDTPLPRTPDLVEGTLDNGLRYFIRANGEPEARAHLRLVVEAGSAYEDDDQLGLAHILEHMAFNGSEHFAEDELVATLESLGMEFGAHTNAYTGTDQTVYMLTLPTDDPAILDTAFTVLEDWSHALTLDGEAIDRERGVVVEEWRRTRGVRGRMMDATWSHFWEGSRYADRLPIGTLESLEGFEHDALRRFYEDWYRPDKMAIVAVGDFEPADIQARIEETFAELSPPESPRPDPDLSVPESTDRVIVFTDPEMRRTGVEVATLLAQPEDPTWGGYEQSLVLGITLGALNQRYQALALAPEPPFLGAGAGHSRLTPGVVAEMASVGTRDDRVLEGLDALLVELERLRRHGLTQAELDSNRDQVLSFYEGLHNEQSHTDSGRLADELVRVATTGESIPGIEHEYRIVLQLLPGLTLEDINARAATFLAPGTRHVEVVMPAYEGLVPPTEDQIRALLADVGDREIAPPMVEVLDFPLVDPEPEPGSITSRRQLDELGVTIWTLSNGAEVWLKPTDFKDDEVLFSAWSPGGRGTVSDADYLPASSALGIQRRSGLGEWDSATLGRRLNGVRAGVSAKMSRTDEGLRGSASPEDLETLLQLTWLTLTAPRFDDHALEGWRQAKQASIQNRANDPDAVFADAYDALMWNDNLRFTAWTEEQLGQLDLEASRAFYAERFGNAADFTFFFVGSFDPAQLEPLVARYLASLPATAEREEPGDDGVRRPEGALDTTVRAGLEPKARLRWRFHGPFEMNPDNRVVLYALRDVIEVLLREELREDLGGVYSVSVKASSSLYPVEEYTLTVEFRCDPDRLQELEEATAGVLRRIQEEGIEASYVEAEQEKNRRTMETEHVSNAYWSSALRNGVRRGEDPADVIFGFEARNAALTPEVLAEAAVRYVDWERYVLVRLLPGGG